MILSLPAKEVGIEEELVMVATEAYIDGKNLSDEEVKEIALGIVRALTAYELAQIQ